MRPPTGFSLIEVLVSVGVFAFIIAAVFGVFGYGAQNLSRFGGHTDQLTRGQNALAMFEKDAILACGATSSAGYPASPSAVAFFEPTFDASGNLIASSDRIVYYASASQLMRDVLPGAGGSRTHMTGQILLTGASGNPLFDYLQDQGGTVATVSNVTAAQIVRVRLSASSSVVANGQAMLSHVDVRMRNRP
jgi:prepilin-type N-terminal cleavage/methylation domain-containing protein